MIRGTTPTHTFNLEMETRTIRALRITYKQGEAVVLEKTEDDVTMSGTTIKVKLTQEDTYAFQANIPVQIQLKIKTTGQEVLASRIKTMSVAAILNEEVL